MAKRELRQERHQLEVLLADEAPRSRPAGTQTHSPGGSGTPAEPLSPPGEQAVDEDGSAPAGQVRVALEQQCQKVARAEEVNAEAWMARINRRLALGGGVGGVILLLAGQPWEADRSVSVRAVSVAIPAMVAILMAAAATRTGSGGLLSFIRGNDGRLSTSLTQVALWTTAIATALIYFAFRDWFSQAPENTFATALGGDLPEAYLLLLGGPFAAAILARLTVGTKIESKQLQKIDTNVAQLKDVFTNDRGQASLVDGQFFLFNLVALVWFVGELFNTPGKLPSMPDLLVGLTSVSALGYLGAKGAESNSPSISSITRHRPAGSPSPSAPIRPNDLVEIRGINFVPPGADAERELLAIVVRFGDVEVSPTLERASGKLTSPSDRSIKARVPATAEAGPLDVVVVTAAGAETDARQISVASEAPLISGLEKARAKPGEPVRIHGRNFQRWGSTAGRPTVLFGGVPVLATTADTDSLSVEVPDIKPGTVALAVMAAGGPSQSAPVSFEVLAP